MTDNRYFINRRPFKQVGLGLMQFKLLGFKGFHSFSFFYGFKKGFSLFFYFFLGFFDLFFLRSFTFLVSFNVFRIHSNFSDAYRFTLNIS